jgi:hypothetical protein
MLDLFLGIPIILPIICLYSELLYTIDYYIFKNIRYFSFYLSLFLFLFSLFFLSIFDKSCFNLQFIFNVGNLVFGVDCLSIFFFNLTVFIVPLCIIYS